MEKNKNECIKCRLIKKNVNGLFQENCEKHPLHVCLDCINDELQQWMRMSCEICTMETEIGNTVERPQEIQERMNRFKEKGYTYNAKISGGAKQLVETIPKSIKETVRALSPVIIDGIATVNSSKNFSFSEFSNQLTILFQQSSGNSLLKNMSNSGLKSAKSYFSKLGLCVQGIFLVFDLSWDLYDFLWNQKKTWEEFTNYLKNSWKSIQTNAITFVAGGIGSATGAFLGAMFGPFGSLIFGLIGAIAAGIQTTDYLKQFKSFQKTYEKSELEKRIERAFMQRNISKDESLDSIRSKMRTQCNSDNPENFQTPHDKQAAILRLQEKIKDFKLIENYKLMEIGQ